MAKTYSFIDIAVLDAVREPFLRGDALVLLSEDLGEVLWANGPGAELLRLGDIERARGAPANIPYAARRQMTATPGFPRMAGEHRVAAKLSPGTPIEVVVSSVGLPSGASAVLLKAPAPTWAAGAASARAISGIAEAGHFAALLDDEGRVLAATDGFARLAIAPDEFAALARDVRHETDRLAKRMVAAAGALYPAGIARLADDPARHMAVIVDDPQPLEEEDAAAEIEPDVAATTGVAAQASVRDAGKMPVATDESSPADVDTWYFTDQPPASRLIEFAPGEEANAEPAAVAGESELNEEALNEATEASPVVEAGEPGSTLPSTDPALSETEPSSGNGPAASGDEPAPDDAEPTPMESEDAGQHTAPAVAESEAALAEAGSDEPVAEQDAAAAPRAAFKPDLDAGPVRFVWKTDAQGRFSALSDEFPAAVGATAADIVGRDFRDVAQELGLDPDDEIAGLLERRDTWSGRTVMWPVQDAALRVPVDLAALPVYARDRSFEGFRGFGVARLGDAVADPDATAATHAVQDGSDGPEETPASADEEAVAADPFRGEARAIAVESAGPERRQSDKVIRLAEHRPAAPERELSSGEKLAFEEIGARLKEAQREGAEPETGDERPAPEVDGAATQEQTSESVDAEPETEAAPTLSDEAPAELHSSATDEAEEPEAIAPAAPEAGEANADEAVEAADIVESEEEPTEADVQASGSNADTVEEAAAPAGDDDEMAQVLEFVPSAFSRPTLGAPGIDTSILERLPIPVLIHSGDTLHYANEEFLRLTGYDSVRQLEYSGGLGVLFAETPAGGDAPEPDHRRRLKTRGGEEFPVEALLQSVPWHRGKALLLALKPAPEAPGGPGDASEIGELEARVEEMRAILDTATDGIVILARDGTIRSISRPAEALFGFDNETVAGKPFVSLFAVESQRSARDYLNGLSDHGVASVLNDGREVIGREAMGRFIPLFMTIGRLPGDSGFCAVLRDITQWKRAEDELTRARSEAETASSQKTEFLARISHEIRTPLNAIIGFSELMLDEKFGPIVNERYRDYLRDINRSGNHVLDLVNDLLDISKIEAGEQELSYEAVSLNEALAEAVAMMQPQANRDRVIIRSSYASKLPEVVADLRSVRQIALNLLSNAVRFTQAGGQVIVSTAYEPSGDVVMRVRDTGIGMSQGEIEQALKPFKQINTLKRARGDGTGLGLPLTKAMVEANRARFAISSAPGEGTLVEIVFPSTRVLAG